MNLNERARELNSSKENHLTENKEPLKPVSHCAACGSKTLILHEDILGRAPQAAPLEGEVLDLDSTEFCEDHDIPEGMTAIYKAHCSDCLRDAYRALLAKQGGMREVLESMTRGLRQARDEGYMPLGFGLSDAIEAAELALSATPPAVVELSERTKGALEAIQWAATKGKPTQGNMDKIAQVAGDALRRLLGEQNV